MSHHQRGPLGFSSLETLPTELSSLVLAHLKRKHFAALAQVYRSIRERSLPLFMATATFGCSYQQLMAPGMESFRSAIVHLNLKQPLLLLHDPDENPHFASSPSLDADTPRQPLLPSLRTLTLQNVPQLRNSDSADISITAFAVIAPHVAREAPNLNTIRSDLFVPDSLSPNAHALVCEAWRPVAWKDTTPQGRQQQPSLYSNLTGLVFDIPYDERALQSGELQSFFVGLILLKHLTRLTLNLDVVPLGKSSGCRLVEQRLTPCGLESLADLVQKLTMLRELTFRSDLDAVRGELCLLTHLADCGVLKRVRTIRLPGRLDTIPLLVKHINEGPSSQLEELHFEVATDDSDRDNPVPVWSDLISEIMQMYFLRLSSLELVQIHVEAEHKRRLRRKSSGPAPVGMIYRREEVLSPLSTS